MMTRDELLTNIVQLTKVKRDVQDRDMDPEIKRRDIQALDEAITAFGRQLAALPDPDDA